MNIRIASFALIVTTAFLMACQSKTENAQSQTAQAEAPQAQAPAAQPEEPAKRKQGLWEITTQTGGQGTVTMQLCVDDQNDNISSPPPEMEHQCSKVDTKRHGDTIEVDSVCNNEGVTMTSHAVVTGDLSSNYKMEQTVDFSPPMNGMSQMHSTMTAKWVGPCQPGQKYGGMSIQGMPGGRDMNISPEMMKQMEKMQQQYGQQYGHP